MDAREQWRRFDRWLCRVPELDITLDVSRMPLDDSFVRCMAPAMTRAFDEMAALEAGAIANRDENRMVGHYWLRAPHRAPSEEMAAEIRNTLDAVKRFAAAVHDGSIKTPAGVRLTQVLSIGIGGSALGPMFVADALGNEAGAYIEESEGEDSSSAAGGSVRTLLDKVRQLTRKQELA